MASEKLSLVTLSGPRDMVDVALQSCVINRDFHIEDAISTMSNMKRLYAFETKNPYSSLLKKAYSVMENVGIEPAYCDFSGKNYTLAKTQDYFERLSESLNKLSKERHELEERISKNKQIQAQLQYLQGVDANISDLMNMKYVKFRYGRIPLENYEDAQERVDHREDVFFFQTGKTNSWVYGIYLALPGTTPQVDSIFLSAGFERVHILEGTDFCGTVEDAARQIDGDRTAAIAKVQELDFMRESVCKDYGKELLAHYSYVRFLSEAFELRRYAGFRRDTFYIIGWISAKNAEEYARQCEQIPGFSCILANPRDVGSTKPPVKTTASFLPKVFTPFLEMYGLPAYGEIDPTLFMAITYIVIFGIMFGDIGQGAVLCLAGFLMWRVQGMWLGRIIACVGVSATVFGFVYGSIFGFEHTLPGFKVMEDGNAMVILMVSVCIGIVLILTCMVLNVINGVRQRDIKKTFFSANGVAGIVFYGGVAAGALAQVMGYKIFSVPYIIIFIVIPLIGIFASEPLTKLCEGEKNWLPKSVGGFIIEGFFELFETMLSYVSNTVSFLRIGAFAISHAGMMSVVFLLTNGGKNVVGLIIGNIIVMGIEAVLVCIQVMRLEFYELFGRFYESGGRRFSPRIILYDRVLQTED